MPDAPFSAATRKSIYFDDRLPHWLKNKARRDRTNVSRIISQYLLEVKAAEEAGPSTQEETLRLVQQIDKKLDQLLAR